MQLCNRENLQILWNGPFILQRDVLAPNSQVQPADRTKLHETCLKITTRGSHLWLKEFTSFVYSKQHKQPPSADGKKAPNVPAGSTLLPERCLFVLFIASVALVVCLSLCWNCFSPDARRGTWWPSSTSTRRGSSWRGRFWWNSNTWVSTFGFVVFIRPVTLTNFAGG